MRTVVLHMGVSLDGLVARPDGAHEWGPRGEDDATRRWKRGTLHNAGAHLMGRALHNAGAHLMGRVTYEQIAAGWPTSTSGYAAAMSDIPEVAFSKTLPAADRPETRIAGGDLAEAHRSGTGAVVGVHRPRPRGA